MQSEIAFHTGRFNLSEQKNHYLNFDNFGEDLAEWLVAQLKEAGLESGGVTQEKWGWYFMSGTAEGIYLVVLKGRCFGDKEKPNYGEWRLIVEKHRTRMDRILRRNKMTEQDELVTTLQRILAVERDITIQAERAKRDRPA